MKRKRVLGSKPAGKADLAAEARKRAGLVYGTAMNPLNLPGTHD
jgi:hypothetical protein